MTTKGPVHPQRDTFVLSASLGSSGTERQPLSVSACIIWNPHCYHNCEKCVVFLSSVRLCKLHLPPHMPLPFHILYNRSGCFPVIMLVEQTVSLIYLGKLSDLVESGCLSSVKCWVKKQALKNSRCPILTHSFEPGRHRQVNVSAHTHSQERIQKLQCIQHINVTLYVNFIT